MSTRSMSNPVKSISYQKAYREAQTPDLLSYALFWFILDTCLHLLGEKPLDSVDGLLRSLF